MGIPRKALQVFAASLIYNYKENGNFREIVDLAYDFLCGEDATHDDVVRILAPCFEGIAEKFCEDLDRYVKENQSEK